MEENRRISWTDLFIKAILAIIFVLLVVWLISLSNKGISNSLDVLTDEIFVKNIERMKEVGKEYFTIERLPKKVGEIKTLTLEEMYEKKLILEVKDKNGNVCDAEDSYVSIEKFDNEYQMKVNLECGSTKDYIIVIMGCYDYCDTDICEKKEEVVENKEIEYEYKKTTGGKWSDYGKWSEWSKVSVTKTDYRQVEVKVELEEYVYEKEVTDTVYTQFEVSCPSGYVLTADKTQCYTVTSSVSYTDPVCPAVSGYALVGRNGFTCNYSKTTTSTTDPVACPSVSGYTFIGRNGFTCNYSKTVTSTTDPVACPSVSGYTFTGRNGFTCNYSKTSTSTANPVCPSKSGWTYTGRNGFTCNYSKTVQSSEYDRQYVSTKTGSYVPADTKDYDYVQIDADYVYDCSSSCAFKWVYTYQVYKKVYKNTTQTTTDTATCPSGYSNVSGVCTKYITETTTRTTSCPSGYANVSGVCTKYIDESYSENSAYCPDKYMQYGDRCGRDIVEYKFKNIIKSCPSGYDKTEDNTKCYKKVVSTVEETGKREVTYYRHRIREYIGGSVDYKWSKSKNDKTLLDAGYKLTGRTR